MFYSYDIFDTLITRKTATPKGIFAVMQDVMQHDAKYSVIPDYIKSDFYTIRIHAEVFARSYVAKNEEITLDEIYSVISKNNNLDEETRQCLINLEYDTERRYLAGIPETIQKIKINLENNDKVVLISDMYLPSSFLREVLTGIDSVFENIPIYVSSETGVQKESGNLYIYVHEKEKAAYNSWIHTGDNINADIKIPKKFGIKTRRFQLPKLLKYEQQLIASHSSCAAVQTVIGCSRYLRLAHPECQDMTLLATIACQMLYPYVSWVIDTALQNKITDLYFIARDGYILQKIAEKITTAENLPVNVHYIYGSRDAWRVPEDFSQASVLYDPTLGFLSVKELAQKLEISYESLKSAISQDNYSNNELVSLDNLDNIFNILEKDAKVSAEIRNRWENKKNLICRYFKQEVDTSHVFALVDVNGSGMSIESLQNSIQPVYQKPLQTFYFTINYYKEIIQNLARQKRYFWYGCFENGLILEAFCRAPHAKCIGYKDKNGQIMPVFEDIPSSFFEEYADYFTLVSELAEEFATLTPEYKQNNGNYLLPDACNKYLMLRPEENVLKAICKIPCEYNRVTKKVQQYAPGYSFASFLQDKIRFKKYGRFTKTLNYEYSLQAGQYPLSILSYYHYWRKKYNLNIRKIRRLKKK
ncbi:MAG TPA: hypothetical protein O0X39_02340 [Methanocorpusculum sp.]|nr:hypothetical protein [Methanocorpusculum sp.]